jgi:hypothetical protein
LPRGGYAKQDGTSSPIVLDSANVASRFAANDWVQVGLSTDNIRKVSSVGGNSIAYAGDNVTVSENDRVFLVGATQPTVTGGSATYTVPATTVRERDDDAADAYTNSMITSDSNGMVQGFAEPNYYDCIIQDGDQANQASVIDLPLGAVGGISTGNAAVFGATVTINGALGVTGWAFFGASVTMHAALGVTGTVAIGSTTTLHAALGVTGHALFGVTATVNGALGVTGLVTTGDSATIGGALTVTNQPRCLVYLTPAGGLTTSVTTTEIPWDTIHYDIGDMVDFAASSETVTVNEAGTYLFNAGVVWANHGTAGGGIKAAQIFHGNSEVVLSYACTKGSSSSLDSVGVNLSKSFYAIAGATFAVRCSQTSGVSHPLTGSTTNQITFFSATKLS